MDVDPVVSLALSMLSNRGAYAVLLGSGASRSAGVKDGWEVVKDLICRVARLRGASVEADPIGWWVSEYGVEPQYSALLGQLGRTASERAELLREYFEPTAEEREQGLKAPTEAHKALAGLAAQGVVRVILTTNFDRLMEDALSRVGVVPDVVTPASIGGMKPLQHSRCTVFKVHGDYMDHRTLNTPGELSSYRRPIETLLRRIFSEYGLVVCGWSAEWDVRLRELISASTTYRYSTYWLAYGEPGAAARDLIGRRSAEVVPVKSADSFFVSLEEAARSLDREQVRHPASREVAIDTCKRLIESAVPPVRLSDLVQCEADAICRYMLADEFRTGQEFDPSEYVRRVRKILSLAAGLGGVLAVGARWGGQQHHDIWLQAIRQVSSIQTRGITNLNHWLELLDFPGTILCSCLGVGAVQARDYVLLRRLLEETRRTVDSRKELLVEIASIGAALTPGYMSSTPGFGLQTMSSWFAGELEVALKGALPGGDVHKDALDRYELLVAMEYWRLSEKGRQSEFLQFVPPFYGLRDDDSKGSCASVRSEMALEERHWPPLAAGMFGGDPLEVSSVLSDFESRFRRE